MWYNKCKGKDGKSDDDDDDDDDNDAAPPADGGNSGTMIVDATCAPSEIRYPQDVSLLDEARENAEQIIDILHKQSTEKKPRTYRKQAHKDSLKYMRSRKHTEKKTREAIRRQLGYLRRDLSIIENMLKSGLKLSEKHQRRLITLQKVYEQQKYMFDNHTHTVPDRIVSISQPFLRPIVRGKAAKPVEFGAKPDISVLTDGRDLNTGHLTLTTKQQHCRKPLNGTVSVKGTIRGVFWRIKSTETGTI